MDKDKYLPANFDFVMASKAVAEKKQLVGFMFRSKPEPKIPINGWCFMAEKDETDPEVDVDIYSAIKILEIDPEIEPYLHHGRGCSFRRLPQGGFEMVDPPKKWWQFWK